MHDSDTANENERTLQQDELPAEKNIASNSEAQKNNESILCGIQSSSDSTQSNVNPQEIEHIIIEVHYPHDSEEPNGRPLSARELRRQRQRRYREQHREVIRERNRSYYSKRSKCAHPNAGDSGEDNIGAVPDDEISKILEEKRKNLKRERARRYRERHPETIKQRNKSYFERQKKVRQGSGACQLPNIQPSQQGQPADLDDTTDSRQRNTEEEPHNNTGQLPSPETDQATNETPEFQAYLKCQRLALYRLLTL